MKIDVTTGSEVWRREQFRVKKLLITYF